MKKLNKLAICCLIGLGIGTNSKAQTQVGDHYNLSANTYSLTMQNLGFLSVKSTSDLAWQRVSLSSGLDYAKDGSTWKWKMTNNYDFAQIRLANGGGINFYGNSNATAGGFVSEADLNNSMLMTMKPSGNIGIGTSSPQYRLDVNGTMRISDRMITTDIISNRSATSNTDGWDIFTSNASALGFYPSTSTDFLVFEKTDANTTTPDGGIAFFNHGTGTRQLSMIIHGNGNVGIGTIDDYDNADNEDYKLSVDGNIRAEKVKVYTGWADYVFDDNYNLMPLDELSTFISDNNHLPNVPSAQEIEEKQGIDVGDMAKTQMEKIEELTLYILDLQKQINELKAQQTTSTPQTESK